MRADRSGALGLRAPSRETPGYSRSSSRRSFSARWSLRTKTMLVSAAPAHTIHMAWNPWVPVNGPRLVNEISTPARIGPIVMPTPRDRL